ncbi:hypothetical protein [Daejeonella oryzae]|uniref:hypothetical protein n=1 Tax=Daejeonella oryzae TaxID=1122943 RepID=UPI00047B7AED|nr:hypothetical protein [Daejeonella oryzae]
MKKILVLLLSLVTVSTLAQDNNTIQIEKLISDKSFAFVSTASYSDKTQKSYDPHKIYSENDSYTTPFPNYEGKISPPGLKDRMLLVEDRPSMANRIPGNNNSEVPVIYINDEIVVLNQAVLSPKFYKLTETAPSELTSPVTYSNYSVKRYNSGKIKVKFNVDENRTKRKVFLTVLPDGQSDLTLSSKSGYSGWESMYFKGYVTEILN